MLCNIKHDDTKNKGDDMNNFGETLRTLRTAQDMGLRETAVKAGISPAYLSRIERGKESPPKPDIIKSLAKVLAADPDVLFRLSSSTDPEILDFLKDNSKAMELVKLIMLNRLDEEQVDQVLSFVREKLITE